jgi:hypothetical protein
VGSADGSGFELKPFRMAQQDLAPSPKTQTKQRYNMGQCLTPRMKLPNEINDWRNPTPSASTFFSPMFATVRNPQQSQRIAPDSCTYLFSGVLPNQSNDSGF